MYKSMEMLNAAEYIAAAQKLGLEYNDKGYDTNFRKAITRTGNIQTIIWLSVVEIHRATIALLLVILIIIPSSVVRGIAI